jgi:hypothetical protein
MSGVYNNWLKVQNPDTPNNNIQMESGGYQIPFFFGGSQIPSSLKQDDLVIKETKQTKINFNPDDISGKGIQSTKFKKHINIHIPRNMKF